MPVNREAQEAETIFLRGARQAGADNVEGVLFRCGGMAEKQAAGQEAQLGLSIRLFGAGHKQPPEHLMRCPVDVGVGSRAPLILTQVLQLKLSTNLKGV